MNQAAADTLNCTICPAGKFQPTAHLDLSISCDDCPGGRFLTDNGLTDTEHNKLSQCLHCVAGKQFDSPTTDCNVCAAGKYQPSNDTAPAVCNDCLLGRYISDDREIDTEHIECKFCAAGLESVTRTRCTFCGAGKQILHVQLDSQLRDIF